jgi:hypothetical protein
MQEMHVNVRGNPHTLGDPVPERFLAVLSPPDPKPFSKGSGRLELADASWPARCGARDRESRVEVALRIGHRGYAGQLRQDGRSAVRSGAAGVSGRQVSSRTACRSRSCTARFCFRRCINSARNRRRRTPRKIGANRLYWRANRQRLDAEAIRDSLLFVSGSLDLKKTGGPSTDFADDNFRRTVYARSAAIGWTISCRCSIIRIHRSPPSSASPPTSRCNACIS